MRFMNRLQRFAASDLKSNRGRPELGLTIYLHIATYAIVW
jgi:hypothetical protein